MNKLQSSTYETNSAPAIKKMQRLVMLASIIGFGLYSLVFAPLYAQLSANVVYQEAFVTYLLYYAMTAVEIAVFVVVSRDPAACGSPSSWPPSVNICSTSS